MDTPMLEARALAKIYTGAPNGGVVALREVSLTVRRGELVMVTGKSGSGKSTLLHLLGCLDRPTAGDVIINGVNSRLFTRDALAHLRSRHIGFVFQDSRLLPHLTVLENVLLPYRLVGERGGHANATTLLDAVGLQERVHHYPNALSGGERQRVAIARALVRQPGLLLVDEPTGNLDAQTGADVLRLFVELVQEATTAVVLVTHQPDLITSPHRHLVLEDGVLGTIPSVIARW